jgi:drug/metabolite transporter (DMT)-like permease
MPELPEVRNAKKSRLTGYALALLAAACWATGGLMAKWLFTDASPLNSGWPFPPLGIHLEPTVLAAGRACSAFLLLLIALAVGRRKDLVISRRDLPFFAVFGVAGLAMVHFTYFKTISLTNVATAILLEYLAPVIVLVIGVTFLRHKFTWALPAGVALSVAGCALVVGAFGGGLVVSPEGIMWGLLSAAFFAGYSLMGTYAASRYSPYTTLVWGLGFASLFWVVVLGPRAVLGVFSDSHTVAAVLFMAVVSTVVPFAAFLTALKYIAPTNATVTSTVEPFLAAVGAFLLFGEKLTAMQMLGGVLVVMAIVVVQLPDVGTPASLPPQD